MGRQDELEEAFLESYSINIASQSIEPQKLFRSIHNLYVFYSNNNAQKGKLIDSLISEDLSKIRLPPLYQKEKLFLSAVVFIQKKKLSQFFLFICEKLML